MNRQITGWLAWGALALVISVPSAEIIYSSSDKEVDVAVTSASVGLVSEVAPVKNTEPEAKPAKIEVARPQISEDVFARGLTWLEHSKSEIEDAGVAMIRPDSGGSVVSGSESILFAKTNSDYRPVTVSPPLPVTNNERPEDLEENIVREQITDKTSADVRVVGDIGMASLNAHNSVATNNAEIVSPIGIPVVREVSEIDEPDLAPIIIVEETRTEDILTQENNEVEQSEGLLAIASVDNGAISQEATSTPPVPMPASMRPIKRTTASSAALPVRSSAGIRIVREDSSDNAELRQVSFYDLVEARSGSSVSGIQPIPDSSSRFYDVTRDGRRPSRFMSNGSFESQLPATRGNSVRLDLLN